MVTGICRVTRHKEVAGLTDGGRRGHTLHVLAVGLVAGRAGWGVATAEGMTGLCSEQTEQEEVKQTVEAASGESLALPNPAQPSGQTT